MGRGYIVEDAVEGYLSGLCEQPAAPVSGLLIGQSSAQRDFVVMATRTPAREEGTAAAGDAVDKEWLSEHARQVSRMLPGGLSVLGVFFISDADAKNTLTSLRQLVFAAENLISQEQLWTPAEDDVTDRVTLHVNPKTRKTVCRTFDVKDPKSTAKPADWRYQSGVSSSWSTLTCCLHVDVSVPLPDSPACTDGVDAWLQEGLKVWSQQIEAGVCLIDGRKVPEDGELTAGQKRSGRQTFGVQLLITPDAGRGTDVPLPCGGVVAVRGAVHGRAYVHNNKPRAKLAEKLLKRDLVSSLVARVRMLLEELRAGGGAKRCTGSLSVPRRVFCPVAGGGPLSVCDYEFSGEGLSEVTERLKEMLDVAAAEGDLDTAQEEAAEVEVTGSEDTPERGAEPARPPDARRNNYLGVAMATAVALLATAASMLYLNDI